MQRVIRLRFVSGPLAGRVHEYRDHDVLTVGRARDAAIRLPADDDLASRHHCVIEVNPPHAVLRDLGSRHGTRLNGRDLDDVEGSRDDTDGSAVLRDGDEIQVGCSSIRVEQEGARRCETCDRTLAPRGACPDCATTRIEDGSPTPLCSRCGNAIDDASVVRRGETGLCLACSATAAIDAPLQGRDRGTREMWNRHADAPLPRFAGYTAVREIGTGGMGAVYLAQRDADRSWVALKVLLARVAVQEVARERFAREIDIIDQLHHPNIVRFLDRGSVGQTFYLAMEFCPAGSAAQLARTRGGRLALGEATSIVMQALEGLDHAHHFAVQERLRSGAHAYHGGIVHRDVKPANLLLSGSERGWHVKLSDFGLAKGFETAGLSGCTSTGAACGSLPFMAPEQMRDFKHVGAAGDLFSLGATYYTLLAGIDPRHVRGKSFPLRTILEGTIVPLRDVVPAVPAGVARVVESALAFRPEARPASAGWMISDLSRAVYGPRATAQGVALEPYDQDGAPPRMAVVLLCPRPAQPFAATRARAANRALHESVVAVLGHTGPRALSLLPEGAAVVLDDVRDALDLALRIDIHVDRKRVPLRRVLHVAAGLDEHAGVPAGPQFDWARAVARVAPTRGGALLVTEAAAAALPRAALASATWLPDVAVGRDRRSTRLASLAPPTEPS